MPLHTFFTPRLSLTPLTSSPLHLRGFHSIWSNEEATKWSPHRRCTTLAASKEWMAGILPATTQPSPIAYGVFARPADETGLSEEGLDASGSSEQTTLGIVTLLPCQLSSVDARLTGLAEVVFELGFIFHPAAWGFGYATEAVNAVLARHRAQGMVIAEVKEANGASRRVLEKAGLILRRSGNGERYPGEGLVQFALPPSCNEVS